MYFHTSSITQRIEGIDQFVGLTYSVFVSMSNYRTHFKVAHQPGVDSDSRLLQIGHSEQPLKRCKGGNSVVGIGRKSFGSASRI